MNKYIAAIAVMDAALRLPGPGRNPQNRGSGHAAGTHRRVAERLPGCPDRVRGRSLLLGEAADADAILGAISPEILHAAHKLKWVQVYSAGVENYLFPEFQSSDVVLTNCKILMGPEIADHAFALLLSLTRELNRIIPTRPNEEWQQGGFHPIELRGKTAVIVGVGGIGSQIAQRAHAFGMTVIGVDPKDMPLNPYVSRMVYPEQIDTVLPLADVVFISAPHTPKSEGMIGPASSS
jgi:phosphoglycerate dehydrogenase-like enzyme